MVSPGRPIGWCVCPPRPPCSVPLACFPWFLVFISFAGAWSLRRCLPFCLALPRLRASLFVGRWACLCIVPVGWRRAFRVFFAPSLFCFARLCSLRCVSLFSPSGLMFVLIFLFVCRSRSSVLACCTFVPALLWRLVWSFPWFSCLFYCVCMLRCRRVRCHVPCSLFCFSLFSGSLRASCSSLFACACGYCVLAAGCRCPCLFGVGIVFVVSPVFSCSPAFLFGVASAALRLRSCLPVRTEPLVPLPPMSHRPGFPPVIVVPASSPTPLVVPHRFCCGDAFSQPVQPSSLPVSTLQAFLAAFAAATWLLALLVQDCFSTMLQLSLFLGTPSPGELEPYTLASPPHLAFILLLVYSATWSAAMASSSACVRVTSSMWSLGCLV